MNNCNCKSSCTGREPGCSCNAICSASTQTLVRGLLALFFGLLFLGLAYKIIIKVVFFCVGAGLVYYGFYVLGVKQVTDAVDTVVARIRRLFFN